MPNIHALSRINESRRAWAPAFAGVAIKSVFLLGDADLIDAAQRALFWDEMRGEKRSNSELLRVCSAKPFAQHKDAMPTAINSAFP